MSLLGSLTMAWVAVHLYVAAYHGVLYLRKRAATEYLAYSVLSLSFAVYSLGAALGLEAQTAVDLARAERILFIGVTVGIAAFVVLSHELARARGPLSSIAVAVALFGVVIDLTGAMFTVEAAGGAPIARLAPWGLAWALTGLAVVVGGLLVLADAARRDRFLRVVFAATLPAVAAFAVDLLARSGGRQAPHVLEHALVVASLTVSHLFMRRLVHTADEVARRTLELRRSYDELRGVQLEIVQKEQLAAVGELSAVVAHEVRNPLAVLKNAAGSLRKPGVDPEIREELLGLLDEEVERLNRLVRDLLAYARPVTIQLEEIALDAVVRRAIDLALRGVSRVERLSLDVDLSGAPARIKCDRDLLERAVINVVENAAHAMATHGQLTVRAHGTRHEGRDAVILSFVDTGAGMDRSVRQRATTPFFTTRPTGTGLGLAIVERVARAHGGRLDLDSGAGRGTCVGLVLPVDGPLRER